MVRRNRSRRRGFARGMSSTMPRKFDIAPWNVLTIRLTALFGQVTMNDILSNLRQQLTNTPNEVDVNFDVRLKYIIVFPNQVVNTQETGGSSTNHPSINMFKGWIYDLSKPSISSSHAISLSGREMDLTRQPTVKLSWPRWQTQIVFNHNDPNFNVFAINMYSRVYVKLEWRVHYNTSPLPQ